MAEPVLLARRTWPEVRDLLATTEVVLVPVGAHEQHGRGIALATDTLSAEALCHRAAARLGERGCGSAVPYGGSWHHLPSPGTTGQGIDVHGPGSAAGCPSSLSNRLLSNLSPPVTSPCLGESIVLHLPPAGTPRLRSLDLLPPPVWPGARSIDAPSPP